MIGQCEKMQACNSCSSISLIKAQFVVQDFSQRLNIDYEETYSPVMDAITFKFFIDLVVVLMINWTWFKYSRLPWNPSLK